MDNIDPKLKEAYQRVMGTTVAPSTSPPAAVINETSKPIINNEGMPLIKKILIALLGLIVVLGYTLFWVIIFHIKVPYLPF